MKFLVTGAAGFIGFHVSKKLVELGHQVIGVDNLNDYYDVKLKQDRLEILQKFSTFSFRKIDIANRDEMEALFSAEQFERVIHLAGQAGVRYSINHPHVYAESNLIGHLNVLEGCRHNQVQHLVYASSSSVYGLNKKLPFSTEDSVDHPVSLYAATKKANELMSHSYAHLYQLPVTGLRFFTVYGPWGRPDMALFKFTRSILANEAIDVYNYGKMQRDFTYIDDIVEAIVRLQDRIPQQNPQWSQQGSVLSESSAPYKIYNIGNNQPVELMEYIEALELALARTAEKNMMPLQPGDVLNTSADTSELYQTINFKPETSVEDGVKSFVNWYRDYYKK